MYKFGGVPFLKSTIREDTVKITRINDSVVRSTIYTSLLLSYAGARMHTYSQVFLQIREHNSNIFHIWEIIFYKPAVLQMRRRTNNAVSLGFPT